MLMRDGMSADDAITLIRKQRNQYALDNAHFVDYLKKR
jgi:hypothetical protein